MAPLFFATGAVMLLGSAILAMVALVPRWSAWWYGQLSPFRFAAAVPRRLAWRYVMCQLGVLGLAALILLTIGVQERRALSEQPW